MKEDVLINICCQNCNTFQTINNREIMVADLIICNNCGQKHQLLKLSHSNVIRTEKNPNGLMKDFKLLHGCQIISKHGWYRKNE